MYLRPCSMVYCFGCVDRKTYVSGQLEKGLSTNTRFARTNTNEIIHNVRNIVYTQNLFCKIHCTEEEKASKMETEEDAPIGKTVSK
ncbi:hypothetical protein DPMN_172970 [Dreissena polymorpha]|uniref:Uncharacterized protein n=1 Tax=Dreissena polymorpha TaxID=45954 RepID=A0A9D4E3T5_DREPO|nr:hypothetical protein DPMN_172970 [Dreissena polymorpha]